MRILSALFALVGMLAISQAAMAGDAMHKIAFHVDQNDPAVMNLALNNVANVRKYYQAKGETVQIEVITYGPGLNMLVDDTSPVTDRIAAMSLEDPSLQFSACGNTHAAMSKKAGHDIQLIAEATMVPSGVVRLMELQEQGYSYVKP